MGLCLMKAFQNVAGALSNAALDLQGHINASTMPVSRKGDRWSKTGIGHVNVTY